MRTIGEKEDRLRRFFDARGRDVAAVCLFGSARIRFEVRTRNEYFDLEPYLIEYRRPRTMAGAPPP